MDALKIREFEMPDLQEYIEKINDGIVPAKSALDLMLFARDLTKFVEAVKDQCKAAILAEAEKWDGQQYAANTVLKIKSSGRWNYCDAKLDKMKMEIKVREAELKRTAEMTTDPKTGEERPVAEYVPTRFVVFE
jgi:hypothetical protein